MKVNYQSEAEILQFIVAGQVIFAPHDADEVV